MSKKIGINEFFDDSFAESLKALSDAWKQHSAILVETLDEIKNVAKAMKKQSSASKNTTKAMDAEAKMARRLKNSRDELLMSVHKSNQEYRENLYRAKQINAQKSAEAKINKTVEGSYNRLSAELELNKIRIKDLGAALGAGGADFKKLADKIKETEEKLTKMDKMMGTSKRNVGNYSSALKGAKIQTANYGKSVQRVTGLVKRFAAVYLGFEAFRSAVRTTRDLTVQTDSLRLAYSKIIPDSQKLAKTNQFLRDTAEDFGVDLNSLRKNYLRFTAASKSSNLTMEESQAIFKSVAKAGSVMGLEAVKMDRAFNALEQMLSKGKVSSEELRQQLGDSLPGSMEIMADALDVNTLKLSEMLEQGKILSDDALKKFAKQLEITYGIENLNRVENLAASQGRLKTAVIELVESMETTGVFRDFYTGLADGVKYITKNIDAVYRLGKALVVLGASYGILRLMNFAASIQNATKAMAIFNVVTKANTLGLVLAGITSLIGLFTIYKDKLTDLLGLTSDFTRFKDDLNEKIDETIAKQSVLNNLDDTAIANLKEKIKLENVAAELQRLRIERAEKEIELESASDVRAGFAGAPVAFSDAQKIEQEISAIDSQIDELLDFGGDKAKQAFALSMAAGVPSFDFDATKTKDKEDEDKDKARKELEAAKAAEFKKEQAIINTMEDGFAKRARLLKLNRDREAWEWRAHKDLLILIEEQYQREIEALIVEDYVADADAAAKRAEDAKRKKKEQLAEEKRLIDEFKIGQQIAIEEGRLKGDTKFDEEFMARQRKIDLLKEELKIRTDLTEEERELMELQIQNLANWYETSEAQVDFLKTTMGGTFLQAVFGPMGAAGIQGLLQGKKPKGEKVKEIQAPKVFGKGVDDLFGLDNQAQVDALVEGFKLAKDAMTDYYQTAIQLANQLIQTRRQEVQSAEKNLQNEIANRNAGRANFIDDAQARLDAAKEAEEEAIKNRQKLQQEKLVMDTVTQASNLITGVSEIWKVYGSQPWLAGALTAGMFGAFAVSKVKAFEATRQEFAEGDLSIIGGGRHGSGKDTLVGYEGNRAQFAERGEARMILSRRATARYADILPSLFEQLSNGTFDADRMIGRNAHISQSPVIFNADMSDTNSELSRIRKQGEEREYAHSDRTIIKRGRFKQILRH